MVSCLDETLLQGGAELMSHTARMHLPANTQTQAEAISTAAGRNLMGSTESTYLAGPLPSVLVHLQ